MKLCCMLADKDAMETEDWRDVRDDHSRMQDAAKHYAAVAHLRYCKAMKNCKNS